MVVLLPGTRVKCRNHAPHGMPIDAVYDVLAVQRREWLGTDQTLVSLRGPGAEHYQIAAEDLDVVD